MVNPKSKLPVLVYDGDCSICLEWVNYWHKHTGETVVYLPYQKAAVDYPKISVESFKQSIQYIETDGKITAGAEACLRLLKHKLSYKFLYWVYLHLPGFSMLCEFGYTYFSQHRKLLAWICHLLWGKNFEPARYEVITWVFLRCLGFIYLAAFASLGVQIVGLAGAQGIVPLDLYLEKAFSHFGTEAYFKIPTLFWFDSSDAFLEWICLAGIFVSAAILLNLFSRTSLFIAYLLYLSLYYAGQTFMTFQWDLLLLEAGFLALFLPTRSHIVVWLYRWLAFRFMFLGGAVKIISRDPTWDNLTALSYHFETQPLPTSLAWHFHHFSESTLMTMAAVTLIIELLIPFLIFLPRKIRFIAAFLFIVFQIFIILTGNYNFFNLLTIAFCLFLFDDAAIRWLLPKILIKKLVIPKYIYCVPLRNTLLATSVACLILIISTTQFWRIFTNTSLPISTQFVKLMSPFNVVNTYGPFAIMTTRRVEINIEGSNNGKDWKEYKFKYKPDNLNQPLNWIIPHQPRLDWQMWFAALRNHKHHPWFGNLIFRLLQGSPEVISLFKNNPFPQKPPLFIRATAYEYHFTDPESRQATQQWWTREYLGNYFPVTRLPEESKSLSD